MAAKKTPSYDEAIHEIEQILEQVELGNLEIDQLSEKLKRISQLISICKTKIGKTEDEIEKILKNIESQN